MWRLAMVLVTAGATTAQLTLNGVRCGQLTCQLEEYCSPETNRCTPCSGVCNSTHHNYDPGLCIKECQAVEPEEWTPRSADCGGGGSRAAGYLLDLRYVRRTDSAPASPTDISAIERLVNSSRQQALTALIVSGVALALLLLVIIIVCRSKFSWRYIKQKFQPTKNRVKQYPTDLTHHNPHAEMPKPKHDLKLEIRNPEPPKRHQPLNVRDLDARTSHTEKSHGATTPKTISTALSNRHPAEDTTLDFSYDNMAMNVTPPEQPAVSHRF